MLENCSKYLLLGSKIARNICCLARLGSKFFKEMNCSKMLSSTFIFPARRALILIAFLSNLSFIIGVRELVGVWADTLPKVLENLEKNGGNYKNPKIHTIHISYIDNVFHAKNNARGIINI